MASTKRRYSKEEFARRGDEIYETQVRSHLKDDDEGKFAAIDIESGAFVIDVDELNACDQLNARISDAQIWLVRVGSRYLHRFGGREVDEADTDPLVGMGLLTGYELKMQVRSRGKVTIKRLPSR